MSVFASPSASSFNRSALKTHCFMDRSSSLKRAFSRLNRTSVTSVWIRAMPGKDDCGTQRPVNRILLGPVVQKYYRTFVQFLEIIFPPPVLYGLKRIKVSESTNYGDSLIDRKSTRLNSSHLGTS